MPEVQKIQWRRGTAAAWTAANPVLSAGTPGFESDTGKFKVGDGVKDWKSLAYQGDVAAGVAAGAVTATVVDADQFPVMSGSALKRFSWKDLKAAVHGSGFTGFYDDFTLKPDGPLSAGDLSASGHPYRVLARPLNWVISGGALTHVVTSAGQSQSSYLGVNLGVNAGDKVGYIWADFEVPAGAMTTLESIVLVASINEFTNPDMMYSDCAAHCLFSETAFRYDKLKRETGAPSTIALGRGQYPQLVPGVYRVAITIDGQKATVLGPDGSHWRVQTDPEILSRSGPWASIQLNNNAGARSQLRILRWGADLQSRETRGSYVSHGELHRAVTSPGSVMAATQTTGTPAVSIPITTSLSAELIDVSIAVPASRRLLFEGSLFFENHAPPAATTTPVYLAAGIYPEGVGSKGKLITIRAADPNDEVGSSPVLFSQIVELDSSFGVGQAVNFQVKAQASAAGLFTFVDGGTGAFNGMRRSVLKVTDLPSTAVPVR
jgi:hypothetical protein